MHIVVRRFNLSSEEVHFSGGPLQKIPNVLKNASKENCIKLNFLQKTLWVHVFISSMGGARGHQKFAVVEIMHRYGKVSSLWRLNAAESTDCIEKCFKQKLYKIKFPRKNFVGARLYIPQEWS